MSASELKTNVDDIPGVDEPLSSLITKAAATYGSASSSSSSSSSSPKADPVGGPLAPEGKEKEGDGAIPVKVEEKKKDKPHVPRLKGGNDVVKAEALSLRHQATHLPANPHCHFCLAKAHSAPHTGNWDDVADDSVFADIKIVDLSGEGGTHTSLKFSAPNVMVAHHVPSSYTVAEGLQSRSHENCLRSLRKMKKVAYLYSDNADEITSCAEPLGAISRPSIAYDHVSNSPAERAVMEVTRTAKCCLLSSGLSLAWSAECMRFASAAVSVARVLP